MFVNYHFCLLIFLNLIGILLSSNDLNSVDRGVELKYTETSLIGINQQLSRKRRYSSINEENEGEYKKRKMGESLETISEIHSIWLTEGQKEELREDLKNGKALDGEIYEKVLLWFSRWGFTEWSYEMFRVSLGCITFFREGLRDLYQAVDILSIRVGLLTAAECNNFGSDLYKLAAIADDKVARNNIVKHYCGFTKNNTKIRNKRNAKIEANTRTENKLQNYFKILNLNWLDDKQREHLKNMSSERKLEEMRDTVYLRDTVINWFNHLRHDAKARAADLFKGGCNKLLKIRQEGCGYFGTLDTQKINELKNYDDLTTYNKMKELINPLIEKVELRKIANDYNRTCKELFGIGEEEERREGGRHRRTPKKRGENNRKIPSIGWEGEDEELGNDYNSRIFNVEVNDNGESGRDNNNNEYLDENDEFDLGHEHMNEHKSWLNADQKRHLKRMRDQGHESVELHDQIHKYSKSSTNKEVKLVAKAILSRGCNLILKRLFGEYIADEIIQAKEEGASDELDNKIYNALGHIKSLKKRREARKFVESCRSIFTMIENP